jgi:hypothetical protein
MCLIPVITGIGKAVVYGIEISVADPDPSHTDPALVVAFQLDTDPAV